MGRRNSINVQLAFQESHETSVIFPATTLKPIILPTRYDYSQS
jgi:hypothetical protein